MQVSAEGYAESYTDGRVMSSPHVNGAARNVPQWGSPSGRSVSDSLGAPCVTSAPLGLFRLSPTHTISHAVEVCPHSH
jgi:hypothetical protein